MQTQLPLFLAHYQYYVTCSVRWRTWMMMDIYLKLFQNICVMFDKSGIFGIQCTMTSSVMSVHRARTCSMVSLTSPVTINNNCYMCSGKLQYDKILLFSKGEDFFLKKLKSDIHHKDVNFKDNFRFLYPHKSLDPFFNWLGQVKKQTCLASPPASFLGAAWILFLFLPIQNYILKTVKCQLSHRKIKYLQVRNSSFIDCRSSWPQSPVHTNDPFGFFPATLCNCSSTNDRVTFVFLHEDRIRQFFIVVATCSRGTDSSVMTSIVWPYATPSTHADVFNTKLGQVG